MSLYSPWGVLSVHFPRGQENLRHPFRKLLIDLVGVQKSNSSEVQRIKLWKLFLINHLETANKFLTGLFISTWSRHVELIRLEKSHGIALLSAHVVALFMSLSSRLIPCIHDLKLSTSLWFSTGCFTVEAGNMRCKNCNNSVRDAANNSNGSHTRAQTHTHTHTQAHMHTRAGTLTQGWWNSNNVAPIIDRSDALTPSCFAQYATFQTDTKLQLWEKTRLRTERLGRQVATIGKIVIPWVVSCFLIQEQSRTSRIQKLMKLLWTRVGKLVWAILFISRTCIIFGGTPSCIGLTAIVRWPLPASSRAYQQTKTQGSTCPYWLLW